ncbi:MAG: hypothetical protein WAV47_21430, partial [Blastocatellia bacterium]
MTKRDSKGRDKPVRQVLAESTAGESDEPRNDASLKDALKDEMDRFRTRLLANVIINSLIPFRRLKSSVLAALAASAFLASMIFLSTTLISRVVNHKGPVLSSALFASILIAYSLATIKILHDGIFPEGSMTFPQNLPSVAKDKNGLTALAGWFQSFLSTRRQIVVSTLFGVSSIFTLAVFALYASANFKLGSYVLVFLCFFVVGNGAYCAIGIPTLLRTIHRQKMKLFWLSPADTPWVKEASWIFTKLFIADSTVAGWAIIGLYLLRPLESRATTAVALIWLVIALLAILYT